MGSRWEKANAVRTLIIDLDDLRHELAAVEMSDDDLSDLLIATARLAGEVAGAGAVRGEVPLDLRCHCGAIYPQEHRAEGHPEWGSARG